MKKKQKPEAVRSERNRRYYVRKCTGKICVTIEVNEAVLGFLVECRWVGARDGSDPEKIGQAISRGLELSARAQESR